MAKRRSTDPMNYRTRAARVEAARLAVNAAADRRIFTGDGPDGLHPSIVEWKARVGEFWAAMHAFYPEEFWEAYDGLKAGDPATVDVGIAFLEADPICHRSGYIKADLLRFLGRVPLTAAQADRLRAIILAVAATRDGREFRRYCALARKLDTAAFRRQLRELAESDDDSAVRRRAGWVLDALPRTPQP